MKLRRQLQLLFLLLPILPVTAQVSFGESELFNDDWLFMLEADSTACLPSYDDSRWRHLSLPHDWSAEGTMSPHLASCTGYLPGGTGWYRKHFKTPLWPSLTEAFFIYFEGIYNRSKVYLNGHLLGYRPNGYASFLYDMTPYLNKKGEDNVLAVYVNHVQYADSRWYTGSGIYRDVWLIRAAETHLAQWGSAWRVKKITKQQAIVEVDVETDGKPATNLCAEVIMTDAAGKEMARTTTTIGCPDKKTVTLTVKNPHRWNLDDTYLYNIETRLSSKLPDAQIPKLLDKCLIRAGLRTLEFSPDHGFALNGQWMKVKGVCLHHDAGVLGAVVPREVWQHRLEELKKIGVNAIRMSHNPQAPLLYDLCDEMGFLVMDEASDEWEFPKRKWIEGWNRGKPGYEGSFDFFEEWIDRDVADMVRRDRNHPSVFLWSIGNEVDYPNDPYSHPILDGDGKDFTQPMYGGYKPEQPNAERIGKIAKRLAAVVRNVDSSRAVTGALAGVVMSNQTEYPEAIDVVGYNYTESRYQEDHARYPNRVIYGSENRHDYVAWRAVRDNEHIFGQFLWTGADYLGESGPWPARGSSAGLLDLASQRKPNGWYRASLWSDDPVIYIGSYPLRNQQLQRGSHGQQLRMPRNFVSTYATDTWNYREGQRVRVVCYSNQPDVRLLLNGQPVGGEATLDTATNVRYWDIDYQPGTLRAEVASPQPSPTGEGAVTRVVPSSKEELGVVGQNGQTFYEIKTTGRPYALRVSLEHSTPLPRREGQGGESAESATSILTVEVVDENGIPVRLADNMITCVVSGRGTLLGLENGDMSDTSSGRSRDARRPMAQRRAYQGRLVAYVKVSGNAEPVRVTFSSPLLQEAEITL